MSSSPVLPNVFTPGKSSISADALSAGTQSTPSGLDQAEKNDFRRVMGSMSNSVKENDHQPSEAHSNTANSPENQRPLESAVAEEEGAIGAGENHHINHIHLENSEAIEPISFELPLLAGELNTQLNGNLMAGRAEESRNTVNGLLNEAALPQASAGKVYAVNLVDGPESLQNFSVEPTSDSIELVSTSPVLVQGHTAQGLGALTHAGEITEGQSEWVDLSIKPAEVDDALSGVPQVDASRIVAVIGKEGGALKISSMPSFTGDGATGDEGLAALGVFRRAGALQGEALAQLGLTDKELDTSGNLKGFSVLDGGAQKIKLQTQGSNSNQDALLANAKLSAPSVMPFQTDTRGSSELLGGKLNGLPLTLLDGANIQQVPDSVSELGQPLSGRADGTTGLGLQNLWNTHGGRIQIPVAIHFTHPGWSAQVAEKTAQLVGQNLASAQLQLDPPELGPLQVKIQVQQDQASVTFVSANPAVRDALDTSFLKLKDLLQEQGLQLVDAGVSDRQNGDKPAQDENPRNADRQSEGGFVDTEDESQEMVTQVAPWGIDHFV